jgi:hypothetical protein
MDHRLLEPGWAGEVTPEDVAFIKERLRSSGSLRRRWRVKGEGLRLSSSYIRRVAIEGFGDAPKSPEAGRTPLETKLGKNIKPRQLSIPVGRE